MTLYRCAGDIVFDDSVPHSGQISSVILKNLSETCNFLQYLKPLSYDHPYFCAQIRSLAINSKITLGIAGPDILEGTHPGNWNNTVGYHSDSGRCYTSHREIANTKGEGFGIGDIFGVQVTHFGSSKCTVVFSKNGRPVATRFLFESDPNNLLPTISLENGPVDLGLMWPDAVSDVPVFDMTDMNHWISSSDVTYDPFSNMFIMKSVEEEVTIQSPVPLSPALSHFEVIIRECSDKGVVPSIAISSCSPIKPAPTNNLLRDYLRWNANDGYLKVGHHLGWGICYLPCEKEKDDFDPLCQQLVLCYVTINTMIAHKQIILQPEGGFYPLVILKNTASKASIDVISNPYPMVKMNDMENHLLDATKALSNDQMTRDITRSMFRTSESIDIEVKQDMCRLTLPANTMGIHAIQFLKPLTVVQSNFFIEVQCLNEDSFIGIGIADNNLPLKKQPGKVKNSVGWLSRDGKLYFNGRNDSYVTGERYFAGDTAEVRLEYVGKNTSVVVFNKNNRTVGCRYLSESDHSQFLPTVTLCGNGYKVVVDVCWQNQNTAPPKPAIDNLENWCLPPGSVIDYNKDIIHVKHHSSPVAIQSPVSLNQEFNHFEIVMPHTSSTSTALPIIGLTTPSPFDPPSVSNFKQDLIRFSGFNNVDTSVKEGDRVGWGLLYLDTSIDVSDEQLVICYLTINRDVQLARVIYQPDGGFYPIVILPPALNMIQLDFSATIIREHPFTNDMLELLITEALQLLEKEDQLLAQGADIEPLNLFRSLQDLETKSKSPENTSKSILKSDSSSLSNGSSAQTKSQESTPKNKKKSKHKRSHSKGSIHKDEVQSKSCTIL
ncbi:uncharacterized protein LOC126809857 isoform X1 [Patella vulgata]|uniref:uncharacterized protein LOC126809857 isoform X1 n=1 Tax=Patella vulgata TaxID=6465 RepID=UPI0024A8CAD4|nr:uncharacterized protein LOC126809857 isoform X1 [Patella vulgata]